MHTRLQPVLQTDSKDEFIEAERELASLSSEEDKLESGSAKEAFFFPGYCLPCKREVRFLVDYRAGGSKEVGPNWRELMICPRCQMSNRQRLMAALVAEMRLAKPDLSLYRMEQTTPLYRWLAGLDISLEGSEYFGDGFTSGDKLTPLNYWAGGSAVQPMKSLFRSVRLAARMGQAGGLLHEDVNSLSFNTGQFDVIVSSDVFEHVPDPLKAFSECARVLKDGGELVTTFPFERMLDVSRTRARIVGEKIEYLAARNYHGNPISDEGALVYTDFGWDVLDMMKRAGFLRVELKLYRQSALGHRGPGLLVFQASC